MWKSLAMAAAAAAAGAIFFVLQHFIRATIFHNAGETSAHISHVKLEQCTKTKMNQPHTMYTNASFITFCKSKQRACLCS